MIFLVVLLAIVPLGALADITCPDSSKCPANSTCCAWNAGGGFGCCPVLSGVCCKKDFCCDVGEVCENHFKTCINSFTNSRGPLRFTDTAKPKPRDVPCPGAGGTCPGNDTCCPTGCCPLPNAVCCSDGQHCCPANTVCDVSAGFCIGSKGPVASAMSVKPKPRDVPCPGAGGTCPDGTTCCQTGCCPLPNAVCCSDGEHCCPSGTVCDSSGQYCIGSNGPVASTMSAKPKPRDVPCPGAGGTCPDGTTCCQTGCCPLPNAVCCSDGEHCCPSGTVCDSSGQFCIGLNGKSYSVKSRIAGKDRVTKVLNPALPVGANIVYCPGGQYYCPDYNTCCLLPTGQWGCCPYPSAVCCPDKVHCCPAGTHCGPTSTTCLSSTSEVSASEKFLARLLGK